MKELTLYKFIHENDLEFHYYNSKPILFVPMMLIDEFNQLFDHSMYLYEDGLPCIMKNQYFCFEMDDVCEYFNIDIISVFGENKEE